MRREKEQREDVRERNIECTYTACVAVAGRRWLHPTEEIRRIRLQESSSLELRYYSDRSFLWSFMPWQRWFMATSQKSSSSLLLSCFLRCSSSSSTVRSLIPSFFRFMNKLYDTSFVIIRNWKCYSLIARSVYNNWKCFLHIFEIAVTMTMLSLPLVLCISWILWIELLHSHCWRHSSSIRLVS